MTRDENKIFIQHCRMKSCAVYVQYRGDIHNYIKCELYSTVATNAQNNYIFTVIMYFFLLYYITVMTYFLHVDAWSSQCLFLS